MLMVHIKGIQKIQMQVLCRSIGGGKCEGDMRDGVVIEDKEYNQVSKRRSVSSSSRELVCSSPWCLSVLGKGASRAGVGVKGSRCELAIWLVGGGRTLV